MANPVNCQNNWLIRQIVLQLCGKNQLVQAKTHLQGLQPSELVSQTINFCYKFLLYYLSNGRLREVKNKKISNFLKVVAVARAGRLQEVPNTVI